MGRAHWKVAGIKKGYRIMGNSGRSRVFSVLREFRVRVGHMKTLFQYLGVCAEVLDDRRFWRDAILASLNLSFPVSVMRAH